MEVTRKCSCFNSRKEIRCRVDNGESVKAAAVVSTHTEAIVPNRRDVLNISARDVI